MKNTQPFRGRFELKVDPKFRLSLPSAFREILDSVSRAGSTPSTVITNSQYQGKKCLDVYPSAEWTKLENRIAKLPQLKLEVQNFQRFYLSGGHNVDLDSQGRILIPSSLRAYAQIQTEVVIVGFAGKFEIWAAEIWNGLFETLAEDFTQTLAAVSLLE